MSEKMSTGVPSPEERAKLEKSRTISEAELLKGGAEYAFNENGDKLLKLDQKKIAELATTIGGEKEMSWCEYREGIGQELRKVYENEIKELGIKEGDDIIIYTETGSGRMSNGAFVSPDDTEIKKTEHVGKFIGYLKDKPSSGLWLDINGSEKTIKWSNVVGVEKNTKEFPYGEGGI